MLLLHHQCPKNGVELLLDSRGGSRGGSRLWANRQTTYTTLHAGRQAYRVTYAQKKCYDIIIRTYSEKV